MWLTLHNTVVATAAAKAPGGGTPALPRAGQGAAVATEMVIWTLSAVIVAVIVGWIVVAVARSRFLPAGKPTTRRNTRPIKSAWEEAGKRVQVEPRESEDGGDDGPAAEPRNGGPGR